MIVYPVTLTEGTVIINNDCIEPMKTRGRSKQWRTWARASQ